MTPATQDITVLTADVVAAFVSNNAVTPGEMPGLITSVYGALSTLGAPAPKAEEVRTPAVSAKASVKPDHVTCMECGEKLKMLKRHLMTHHNLTPDEYRARWGLAADHPLVAPEYASRRAVLAKAIGLGRKPGSRKGGR